MSTVTSVTTTLRRRRGLTEEAAVAAVDQACRRLRLPTMRALLGDAVAAAKRAVALAPSDPLCLHNLAVIHYERVEIDESIDCAERALLMSPDLPGAHFARAEALLIKGDWAQGWEEYEWRFRIADAAKLMPTTDKPQWDGKPFDDGVLLLVADQGFGDVIQFSRYIPWVLERCPNAVTISETAFGVHHRVLLSPRKHLLDLAGLIADAVESERRAIA